MTPAGPGDDPVAPPARSLWRSRALKAALLAAVLVVHFLSRQELVATRPMREGWNYPYVYRTSLALLTGRGFGVFRFSGAPESRPVVEFLDGQRDDLSREELRRFRDGPDGRPVAFPLPEADAGFPLYPAGGELKTPLSPLHSTRVFDLYLTALLWEIFGVRWSVLLTFCAVASTVVCLLVFLTGRRLGGGFWPGWCAAVLYLASPLENDFAVRALRDISPLWFAALAFACFVCLVERFRSAPANGAALVLTGFACTLGCGWRPDAMILAPFIGAATLGLLLRKRRGWRYLLAGAAAFLIGAAAPLTAIRLMCPLPRQSPLVVFHMGYYGEYARCNLLGLENTFEASRDDVETALTAQQYLADHGAMAGKSPTTVPYCSPAYGGACFRMYREEVLPNLYRWTSGFPGFFVRALNACRNRDLPINASTYLPPLIRPPWLRGAASWVLGPLSAAGPLLFALGAVVSLLRPGERWRSLCLAAFSVFYAVVLFFALPELKHAGPLVLPLAVFGGVGLAALGALANPFRLTAQIRAARRPAAWLAAAVIAGTAAWGLACALTYVYSRECRRELIAAITKLTADGRPDPAALRSPQLFSVCMKPEHCDPPAGYLLRIAAGPGASSLQCRRLAHADALCTARLFFTRHRLQPNREQCFFVTCLNGTAFGDARPRVCTVLLNGDARFLSCTRVDLSDWRRLPVATVFTPGECDPGNPVVGGTTGESKYTEDPDLNTIGLSFEELLRSGAATPIVLVPSDGGTDSTPEWRPIPGARTEPSADGLRVWTLDRPGAYAVEAPHLTAPADGTYYFQLRYRPEAGRLTLGVLAQDRLSWLAIGTWDDPAGADAERVLQVKLHAGQVFSLVAANGAAAAGQSSVFVLERLSAYRDDSGE